MRSCVDRIKSGDRQAFERLFRRYLPFIGARARRRLWKSKARRLVDAEDVVQEVAIELFRNFSKFVYTDETSFPKWVERVITWKIWDFEKRYFKTAKRASDTVSLERVRANWWQGDDAGEHFVESDECPPWQRMADHEDMGLVTDALRRMPKSFRSVITFRGIQGLSVEQTARAMNLSVQTVPGLLHCARRRLSRMMSPPAATA